MPEIITHENLRWTFFIIGMSVFLAQPIEKFYNTRLKRKNKKIKRFSAMSQEEQSEKQQPIQTKQRSTGNLKQRTIDLADKVSLFLDDHKIPQDQNAIEGWRKIVSDIFKCRYLNEVLDIRNEFSKMSYRDRDLDDFFKYQGMVENTKKQLALIPQPQRDSIISSMHISYIQIQVISERLKWLSDQIN